jgi:carnitine 3-dehydrogenase
MPNIKNVTVIGAGVIGAGWIIRCLAHNKKIVAFDKNSKL